MKQTKGQVLCSNDEWMFRLQLSSWLIVGPTSRLIQMAELYFIILKLIDILITVAHGLISSLHNLRNSPMCPQQNRQTVQTQKLFITPNRDTHPITANLPNRFGPANYPQFDHFSLSAMFSNAILTGQEFNKLKSNGGQEIVQARNVKEERKGSTKGKKSRTKQKGIKHLSKKVYELVLNLQSTSYVQVAHRLIEQLNQAKQMDKLQFMAEKNIKRRVYDVLNVLIAVGLLRKEGKEIMRSGLLKKRLAVELVQRRKALQCKEEYLVGQERKLDLLPLLIESNLQRQGDKDKKMMPFMLLDAQSSAICPPVDGKGSCRKMEIRKKKSKMIKMDLDCLASLKP